MNDVNLPHYYIRNSSCCSLYLICVVCGSSDELKQRKAEREKLEKATKQWKAEQKKLHDEERRQHKYTFTPAFGV